MGTILASAILARASILLQDTTGVRWPAATTSDELFYWLCDAQREIVLRKPEAYAVDDTAVQLTASVTRQSIPAGGIMLLDIVCNMGAAGTTEGRAVTRIDRQILDEQMPLWRSATASGIVIHYMFDPRSPKVFYVYPPQPSPSHYVRMVYSAAPANISAISSAITLDDVYSGVLLDYVLYRAYSKDADLTPSAPQRAVAHYNAFLEALGSKTKVDSTIEPNAYDFKESMEARQVGRG